MQGLAQGVGDLKRVLTNVKSRGTFGETQLASLLEDVLAPDQYASNLVTRPGSDERVDFVVKLPGPELGGAPVLLPIDAKFPVEDYLRLQQAQDAGDSVAALDAQAAFRLRLELEARAIAEKYLCSPQTTDFALLYLCTEGLYAEALRLGGLVDELQRRHRVTVVGPSTLAAFLSSLRAGFRTLAIQQRSSEVWQVLGAVKTEFHRFGSALDGVSKKLQEATNKVDALSARRRVVERTLRDVERLPEPEAAALLPTEATLEVDQVS
jgi:DNA recombination protein RmuC